jgi:tRNA-Thr(GGU) m(6)t(6)A37 methyltransferase TsaA
MPIQPSGARGVQGTLELDPAYEPGLRDLEGFSHLFLIYVFHRASGVQLTVTPFLDAEPHGLFATRAPKRPNPIGLSVVRLIAVEGNRLVLEDVDMLDGTPVLDIKPYVPAFDRPVDVRVGWLAGRDQNVGTKRSDDRFS